MSSSIPNKGTALVLEILPAFFGIYGIGWLYAGKVATGLILLLTGLVVIWGSYAAVFLLGALTLGLGFVCICVVILLQIFIAVLSVLSLNNALERASELSPRP
jgi:TM2 domain-containing membrane protein YozV